eukprot:193201-Amphidinium_carterae.1
MATTIQLKTHAELTEETVATTFASSTARCTLTFKKVFDATVPGHQESQQACRSSHHHLLTGLPCVDTCN